MSDINWRYIGDDFSIYDPANADRDIICKSGDGISGSNDIWPSKCRYIDGLEDRYTCQYVDYYAYLN